MRWPWSRAAAPIVAPVPPVAAKRPGMRVSQEAVARAGVVAAEEPAFYHPQLPPGVLPAKSATLANDEAITSAYGYANEQAYRAGVRFPGFAYLAELAQRPEYRRMSETFAKEMTRRWIRLYSTGEEDKSAKIAELSHALKKFCVQDVFRRVAELDGFFGRAHIYLDTGDTLDRDELKTPLVAAKAKLKKGGLKRLTVVEPVWTYPANYNTSDPLMPNYYQAEAWYVMGKELHASRLLAFVSREVPDLLRPTYLFGGVSLSQLAEPYVENWIRTRQSVSDLLHSFSVSGLKTSMSSTLGDDLTGSSIFTRVDMFNRLRDNRGMMLLDKDSEEFFNVSTPLGTLDHLQAQAQEQQASVSGIPLVKLLGITPSGLNASTDGEIRVFYDWVAAQQQHLFSKPLDTIIKLVMLSEWGEIDEDIQFSFEPLWQASDVEKSTIRSTNATAAGTMIDKGIILPEEERARLASEEGGLYNSLDLSVTPEAPGSEEPGDPGEDPEAEQDADEPESGAENNSEDHIVRGRAANDKVTPEFKESDHPRKDDGKFGSGGGGGGGSAASKTAPGGKGGPAAAKPVAKPAATSAAAKPAPGKAALQATRLEGKTRVMADGSPLPKHLTSLKIPPAWTDVAINPDPKAGLQVFGRDAKGRPQAVYSAEFTATQAAAKFSRIHELAAKFKDISAQNAAAQKSDNPKTRAAADCMDLIMKMGLRPGSESDTGAKLKAYGATTLEGKHVVKGEDGSVSLQFVGKKGVSLNLPVTDQALAKQLTERAAKAGADGQLFSGLSETNLLAYTHTLDGGKFKTKDFRTHLGTSTATKLVASMPKPADPAAYKKAVMDVAKAVSKTLGNTPTVALESYISPTVFARWQAAG